MAFKLTQTLLQLRQDHPALKAGRLKWLTASSDAFALGRKDDNSEVVIAINRGKNVQTLAVEATGATSLFEWNGTAEIANGSIKLAPQSAIILKL